MKVSITHNFDLNNSEDRMSYERMKKVDDMSSLLWEIHHKLKTESEVVLSGIGSDSDAKDGAYVVLQQLNSMFKRHMIDIDKIVG